MAATALPDSLHAKIGMQSAVTTATEVAGLKDTIAGLGGAAAAAAAAKPSRPARAGRPDPSRRYAVNTSGSPIKGDAKAKLAIVEFSDFQCPFCGRVTPTLDQIETEYGEKVRFVF